MQQTYMGNKIGLWLTCFFFTATLSFGQGKIYELDASSIAPKNIIALPFEGRSPSNEKLSVNNFYFEKNDKPWFPLMGEMHYNRVLPEDWEEGLIKMKNGGLNIVAVYVFWNEHETDKGVWDWNEKRDLRKFVEIAAKNGLYIWLRIGPWAHGEQLHGGHPGWINNMKGKRSNNAEYIAAGARLFEQIGQQTAGLYFKDGGPIIGVQLENEFATGEAEHISSLKQIALNAGILPVYWSVTANTVFDDSKLEVIPLQGSYPYRGWERGGGKATKDFLYGNDQWIMTDALGKVYYNVTKFPKGLCEQGVGSQMTYNNRFIVEPHIVEAHLQNQIGRGMNLVGYYMFHGGTQSPGLKEPGYPESYDFQAPISEVGQLRPSYKYLKILHNFINDFGNELAAMQVVEALNPLKDELDTANLRYIARMNGKSGFVFLCNSQVRVTMPDKNIRLRIKLKDETIEFPTFVLKGQTSPILPVNIGIKDVTIRYATAQPFAKIENDNHIYVFFQKLPKVNPQISLSFPGNAKLVASGWTQQKQNNYYNLSAGSSNYIQIKQGDGKSITLVFLGRSEAEKAWRINHQGKQTLLITDADVLYKKNEIVLHRLGSNQFNVKIYPADASLLPVSRTFQSQGYAIYTTDVRKNFPTINIRNDKDSAVIAIPALLPSDVDDIFADISYFGGSAEVIDNGKTATDNLYNGSDWLLGLKRFKGRNITVKIKPWQNQITGVAAGKEQQAIRAGTTISQIGLLPQYKAVINLK